MEPMTDEEIAAKIRSIVGDLNNLMAAANAEDMEVRLDLSDASIMGRAGRLTRVRVEVFRVL